MTFPEKLKAAVCYICQQCDPWDLGAVKLNKILWKSDVYMHTTTGESITGWQYQKYPRGPVLDGYNLLIAELESENAIETEWASKGNREICLIMAKDCSADGLSQREKEVLDNYIQYVTSHHTAASISEESHDTYYHITQDREIVPMGPVMSTPSSEDIDWAKKTLKGLHRDSVMA